MKIKSILILLLPLLLLLSPACRTRQPDKSVGRTPTAEETLYITSLYIDASREKILGNYDKALSLYAQCIQRNPRHDAAMFEMARILNGQRKYDDALVLIRHAVKINSGNKWYQFLYAELLLNKREYDEAAKLYKQLTEKYPSELQLYYDWATVYLYAGKYTDAIKVYDQIEKISGISEELSIQKEKLYLQLGKVNKAIAEINKLIAEFPTETKYLGILAELYMAEGQPLKALDVYECIKKINPADPYVNLSLAEYYRSQGNMEKYREEIFSAFRNPALGIDPKIKILLGYYTITEKDTSALAEAFALASILAQTHHDDPKAHSIHGDFLYRSERYDEARKAFRTVNSLDSTKFIVWQQLLEIEMILGDYHAMLDESARALELFPEQAELYFFNGYALYRKRKYEDSYRILSNGLSFTADKQLQLRIYTVMGDAAWAAGKHDLSQEAFSKALKINPSDLYVLNNYSYYLSLKKTDLDNAVSMADKLNKLSPGNPSYEDTYAWVLYARGDYQAALGWIEKAYTSGGKSNPVILEHFGDILYRLDRIPEAVDKWKEALAAGGNKEALNKKISEKKTND